MNPTNKLSVHIVDNHHEIVEPLEAAGIQNADILHTDGHGDMCATGLHLDHGYHDIDRSSLDIFNFLCYLIHQKIAKSIYWLNPHSDDHRLQDMGSVDPDDGRPILTTTNRGTTVSWFVPNKNRPGGGDATVDFAYRNIVRPEKMILSDGRFVSDTDLDAFCCSKPVQGMADFYSNAEDWKARQDQTLELFASLNSKPGIAMIVRSQGVFDPSGDREYVPPGKVDEIQERYIAGLEQVYGSLNIRRHYLNNPTTSTRL